MSTTLALCLITLALLLAAAGSGIAIAVLERRGVVPRLAERTFLGFAGAGSALLVVVVVSLHPTTGAAVAGTPAPASTAVASPPSGSPQTACVSLADLPAYDHPRARYEGDAARGEFGHEVPVFRSPDPR